MTYIRIRGKRASAAVFANYSSRMAQKKQKTRGAAVALLTTGACNPEREEFDASELL